MRNSKAPVLVAQNASFSDSQRTSPSRETHETDTPDTTTMRRSRVHSEKTASLKLPLDLKKSVTITSQDGVHEREQLGWELAANVAYTLLEKKSILHELDEKVTKSEMNDNPNVSKEQDRVERRVQDAQHSVVGHETKPQLTMKINEVQAERETTTTGKPCTSDDTEGRRTSGCVCPRQTVLRVGGAGSRGGRRHSVPTAEEVCVARATVTGNVSEGDELSTTKAAESNNEVGPRGRTGICKRWFDNGMTGKSSAT